MDFNNTRRSTVRSRRSIFLIAATSFALAFTTLGIAPAGANQQNASSDFSLEDTKISRLLVSYEPGVSTTDASGDITGQSYVPNVDLEDVERIGKNVFTVDLPEAVSESEAIEIAVALEKSPQVKIVEPDYPILMATSDVTITQDTSATGLWGLDRIDQRSSTLNGTYKYDSTGMGVNAYVIDTGIYPHDEFQDRLGLGYNAVTGLSDTIDVRHSTDCSANGHGTHVAGILGGTTYGVAKEVSLIPIRVFNCSGDAYSSHVIAGIDWVMNHHQSGQLAVANMSLGGSKSDFLNSKVQDLINDGVHVVVASGNSNADACNFSPASAFGTITVNSSGITDASSSFSNFGACTDIFAPGEGILSASNSSSTSTSSNSGTSMASPFVAGAVAKILDTNPTFNRDQVLAELLDNSSPFVSDKPGDPSRLLYTPQELTEAARIAAEQAAAAEAARVAAEQAAAAEAARVAAEQAAAAEAARVAAEQAAAAEAARLAAAPAPAAPAPAPTIVSAPAPIVVTPTIKKTLSTKALKKRRIVVKVKAPRGSNTLIQRKVGKKWKTVIKRPSRASQTFRVKRLGTYRVVIVAPNERATSKSFKARR